MDSKDLLFGIMFLSQSAVGIVGNFTLFFYYLGLYYHEHSLKTTNLILKHLTVANSLIILSKGVPHTMRAFGLKQFFSELGCRFLFYFYRVGRIMSIIFTCLLSVFQATTINPSNSCWKNLKFKATKYIGLFISLCWILYMMINLIFPIYISHTEIHRKNVTEKRDFEYCSSGSRDSTVDRLYVALLLLPEVSLSVLIIWSSGSMVAILYRHKQRVQYIHSTVSSRASPESRATQHILTLVSAFLTFYTFSSILHACIALLNNPSLWLMNFTSVISMSFPSFGPFILMSHDSTVFRLCFVWIKNKKSSNLFSNL
uniref:vomeronasal type-1 receptor 4-like n=1 Tax=Jaculus jaculus TaxID=51337 RepID=UPI001E1B3149|nr:vomeronasal type-1 receptor 4-like [Jaculus jaculus]